MYELKTKETDKSVIEFIEQVESLKKREELLKNFGKHTRKSICVY